MVDVLGGQSRVLAAADGGHACVGLSPVAGLSGAHARPEHCVVRGVNRRRGPAVPADAGSDVDCRAGGAAFRGRRRARHAGGISRQPQYATGGVAGGAHVARARPLAARRAGALRRPRGGTAGAKPAGEGRGRGHVRIPRGVRTVPRPGVVVAAAAQPAALRRRRDRVAAGVGSAWLRGARRRVICRSAARAGTLRGGRGGACAFSRTRAVGRAACRHGGFERPGRAVAVRRRVLARRRRADPAGAGVNTVVAARPHRAFLGAG